MRATMLAAAAMACVMATGARADVISSTATLGTFDPYYSERDQTLPGFDATLGTLTSITVSTRAFLSETVQVQPATGTSFPALGTFNAIYNAQIIPSPAADRSVLTQSVSTPISASGTGLVSANFTDSFTVPFADYPVTDGPLVIRYDIFAQPQAGLSFLFDGSFHTTAGGTVTVAYTYDAATTVPEPATLALLGTALVLARRPRKAHAVSVTA